MAQMDAGKKRSDTTTQLIYLWCSKSFIRANQMEKSGCGCAVSVCVCQFKMFHVVLVIHYAVLVPSVRACGGLAVLKRL